MDESVRRLTNIKYLASDAPHANAIEIDNGDRLDVTNNATVTIYEPNTFYLLNYS